MMVSEHDRLVVMLVPLLATGNPVVDQLIREGKLTPASNPAGVAALLAITPQPASDETDSADEVSELRADRS
jgi:hypothetical protein